MRFHPYGWAAGPWQTQNPVVSEMGGAADYRTFDLAVWEKRIRAI